MPRVKSDDKISAKALPSSTSNIPDVIIESHRDNPDVVVKYLKGKLLGKVSNYDTLSSSNRYQ